MLRNELLIFFPQKEFYSRDEVKGYAELRLPLAMTINEVKIEVIGREVGETAGKSDVNVFFTYDKILEGPGSKDHGKNFLGQKVKVASKLNPGNHQYPFAFVLPEHCPPSYSCPNGKIEYEVRVTAESSVKTITNLVSSAILPVGGSLFDLNFLGNNSSPVQVKESKTFFGTKGSFDITINLDSRVFLSGDPVKVRADFNNTTSKTITQVVVKLLQKVEVTYSGKTIKDDEFALGTSQVGTIEKNQSKHPIIELSIPTTAVESVFTKPIQGNKKSGKNILVSYEVFVHCEVPGLLGFSNTDIKLSIPIYVARRQRHQQLAQQQQQATPSTVTPNVQPQQVVQPQVPQQPQTVPQQGVPTNINVTFQMPQPVGGVMPQVSYQPQQVLPGQQPMQQGYVVPGAYYPGTYPQQGVPQVPQQPSTVPEEGLYPSLYPSAVPPQHVIPPTVSQGEAGGAPRTLPPPPRALVGGSAPEQQQQQQGAQQPYDQFFE